MIRRTAVVLAAVALLISCQKFAEGKQLFRDLLTLRDQLSTHFQEKDVDLNISTGGRVTVKFKNSPLNSATHEAKQKRADEVAAFVIANSKHPVTTVSTEFATQRGPAEFKETFVGQMPAK